MIKVLIPSIIMGIVLLGSVYALYRCIIATSWGRWCAVFPMLLLYIIIYGFTWGYCQLKVRNITFESERVPEAFDGYKIAQISDIHCGGGFTGPYKWLMANSVKKVNSLNPDLICFVGDLQNFVPEEPKALSKELSSLKAKDGVYSVMGNHDYVSYSGLAPREQAKKIAETRQLQASFGWTMLQDEHTYIYREKKNADGTMQRDSICLIGEENWGLPPFPQYGDIKKALVTPLKGSKQQNGQPVMTAKDNTGALSVMLSHDPNAWRNHILPVFRPDITLSGHTHGAQFSFFGLTPAQKIYKEWGREYYDDNGQDSRTPTKREKETMLSVSTGFGGNLPFRFGMPREIVLITLKHKK